MKQLPDSILIVDDEQLNLDMLSRRLRRSGFAVDVATSGREALSMVSQKAFDIILLDQMMPELSGSDVLRILRAEFPAEELPIVMVTAVAESDKIAEAIEAGANDYITKPVDFQVALARIRSQLTRKRAQGAMKKSEERYALAAKASQDGLWDWNLVTGAVYFSPRWKEMVGLDREDAISTADEAFSRILTSDREAVKAAVERHIKGQSHLFQCAYRILHASGGVRWMSCQGIVTRDEHGNAIRIAGSQTDVTEHETLDALTGLPNRTLLLNEIEGAVALGGIPGKEQEPYALLLLDLNGFKTINDSLGRTAGDRLLKDVATRLQLVASEYDERVSTRLHPLAARLEGAGFAILLTEESTRENVNKFAAYVQRALKIPFDLEGRMVHCDFSIGVALASASHTGAEEILHDAATAMYAAGTQGRGEVAVFRQEMHHAAMERHDLRNDIRLAAKRNELELVYQPKVDLASGRTYGVEALVRWNHPKRGLLQPDAFIPIAEETGAIVELGSWVLLNACRQVRVWHDLFPMQPPLELSVNLSPSEFKQQGLVEGIRRTLAATAFPASSLHLEITEGVLFEDLEAARSILNALKRIGLSLDLDDFGSGFSSLKYLRELPFDLIKIDRYFTGSLDPDKTSSGDLIKTILLMAKNLGLQVVAEGVETAAHTQMLRDLGCRYGQGYYFSKPIGPPVMQSMLALQSNAMPATDLHIAPLLNSAPVTGVPWQP